MKNKIVGVFSTQQDAIKAINQIKQQGYNASDISVVVKNTGTMSAIESQTGATAKSGLTSGGASTSAGTNGNTGTNSGGNNGNGGFLEEIASFFVGDTDNMFGDTNTKTNANTNTKQGGSANQLTQMGLSQNQAKEYGSYADKGNILVFVNADSNQADQVYQAFTANHSLDTTTAGENQASQTAASGQTGTGSTQNTAKQQQTLQLHEEQLTISKNQVQAGEVQIRREAVEEQKTLTVPVTHEEVYIERRPVTGSQAANSTTASAAGNTAAGGTAMGKNEVIRIPVMEEHITVNKTPVVTEEIIISKREVQEMQQVTDTVKHEEAHLESTGNPVIQGEDTLNQASNTTQ
ncbi:YsnF/AvaK domain-containing protein [Aneurinibacillus tyrosinisolvens]|uniref:YsnF/AvaK domain-containing protein n=1 Tax=Aneurinibacillus tyrosinisolvens TaxID=1443435 RepID=UPI000699609A|nr:YsnF/AvaK domain-containing protein [Aneurinibacillus tyrosinisolvens]